MDGFYIPSFIVPPVKNFTENECSVFNLTGNGQFTNVKIEDYGKDIRKEGNISSVFAGSIVIALMIGHGLIIWVNQFIHYFDRKQTSNKLTVAVKVLYFFACVNYIFEILGLVMDTGLYHYVSIYDLPSMDVRMQAKAEFQVDPFPFKLLYIIQKVIDRSLYNIKAFEWLMYGNYIMHMSKTDKGKLQFKKDEYNKREKFWFIFLMLINSAFVVLYYYTYIVYFFTEKDQHKTF